MTLQELDLLLSLSPEDQQRVRQVLEVREMGLTQALLVAAKHTAFTKALTATDKDPWRYYGATALRMLDFNVSLEEAKLVFMAVKEPTPEQVCRVWDGR